MKGLELKILLWDFWRGLKDNVHSIFRPIVEEYGLTMMQTRILIEIKQYGHLTAGSLCSELGLTSGNASAMCKRLEKAGFIKRNRNPKDERFVELRLTEHGEAIIQQIEDAVEKKYGQFLETRDEEEIKEIVAAIKKFNAIIKEMIMLG
ncbi:MAG: MarR family transcriptional regulator [Desulfotomaculaceae bacterium]|nr:MarR family transcriptional regulator [Desulfotomaculaceae bacterium]